jgi:hypothetical protein
MIEFALVALGITYGITGSYIMAGVRQLLVRASGDSGMFAVLLYCPACMGFWIGALLGAAGLWPQDVSTFTAIWRAAFASTALGALWSHYGPLANFQVEQPHLTADEDEHVESERS